MLLLELIWAADHDDDDDDRPTPGQRTQIRPTWSWISVTGRKRFYAHSLAKDTLIKYWKELASARILNKEEIARSSLTSPSRNPEFVLRLRCPMLRMDTSRKRPEGWPGRKIGGYFAWKKDCPTQRYTKDVEMFFLPLLNTFTGQDLGSKANLFGLIVTPSSQFPGAYERVACAETNIFRRREQSILRAHRYLQHILEGRPSTTVLLV